MKKFIFGIFAIASIAAVLYFFPKEKHDGLRIGLILPVQNVALDDIVDGFKTDLIAHMPGQKIDVIMQNAVGDINLQKSAFNKFINDKVDLVVPVGKGATLMGINLVPKEQPILFLAAHIPPDSPTAKENPSLMGVIDEISVELQLNFMRAAMPSLTKLAVIYVSSDKVFDDVKVFSAQAEKMGITVQQLMVQNLAELYTVASRIEADNQAIFTLKDVMVASGINALAQQANALKIPLITSDEGTIRSGGAFAVGVVEADIGRQGARMAADFLQKKDFSRIQYLDKISVFVNSASCATQGVDVDALKKAAAAMKLNLIEG